MEEEALIWLGLLVHLCEFITICMAAFNGNLGLILFAICIHAHSQHPSVCVCV